MAGPMIVKTVSRIHPGKAAEYRHLVEEICRLAEQREPRLLAFNIYVTDDESSEVVVQVHPDSGVDATSLARVGREGTCDCRVRRLREPGDLRRVERCATPVVAARHRRDHIHSSFDSLGRLHTATRRYQRARLAATRRAPDRPYGVPGGGGGGRLVSDGPRGTRRSCTASPACPGPGPPRASADRRGCCSRPQRTVGAPAGPEANLIHGAGSARLEQVARLVHGNQLRRITDRVQNLDHLTGKSRSTKSFRRPCPSDQIQHVAEAFRSGRQRRAASHRVVGFEVILGVSRRV